MKKYNWATLGCGVIANELAVAMEKKGKKLYSVANRTHEKAVQFAEKYGIEKVYDNIDQVFEDENVDIIYISTPHNTHIEFLRKALKAGKHVLCEKSITLNSEELEEAINLAKENNVVLAEAMTIYHMPIYKKLNEIISSGKLGDLGLIQMNFGSYKEYDMTNRFFNRNLAGEEMATVMLSLHCKQPKRGTIAFDKGYIEIFEYPRGQEAVITYTEDGHKETITGGNTKDALYYEVEDMEKTIDRIGDFTYLEYTKDVMQIMTDIRKQWGMTYPEEEK